MCNLKKIIVTGGATLEGTVKISGAKNAVLPIIIGTILTPGKNRILDVPELSDVDTLIEVLNILGATVEKNGNILEIDSSNINCYETPYE